MYTVTTAFTDTKFGGVYRVGSTYPAAGKEPSQEWIDYLLSNRNKFKKPIIRKMKEIQTPDQKLRDNLLARKGSVPVMGPRTTSEDAAKPKIKITSTILKEE